jgi:hypothetical protein
VGERWIPAPQADNSTGKLDEVTLDGSQVRRKRELYSPREWEIKSFYFH